VSRAVAADRAAPTPPQRARAPGTNDQHVARRAGRADEHLAGLAAQHGGLGSDTGAQAAEGKVEGVLQPLPGVVFPELAQLRAGVLTLMLVTVRRHPGQQGDQDRGVLVGEIGGVTQRVQAAGDPLTPAMIRYAADMAVLPW
jgi:hypothetical protein